MVVVALGAPTLLLRLSCSAVAVARPSALLILQNPALLLGFSLVVVVTMSQENTKLCDFSNTNNSDFISTLIAPPATSAETCDINAALLNLVMKDQFSGSPN